jgi:hypothetical protein
VCSLEPAQCQNKGAEDTYAGSDDARQRIARIAAVGAASRAGRDAAALSRARRDLRELTQRLDAHYEVRIVSRPGEPSGIDRYGSDGRLSGYYVIVEAVRPDGTVLPRTIENAETQRTERVDKWGELVDEKVWQRLVADEKADGVIDERLFAEKLPGHYDERVVLDDGDGRPVAQRRQITRW